LLFAGTEDQVWVSFDDGDHWSSLRLNMPATSIRDLVIKDDDIALATHGRSFYILDDIASLRSVSAATASTAATLFAPASAYRFRWSKYPDTPIPPDEPWAMNPPDGAIIDYFVGTGANGDATLEIVEPDGRVVRTYSSRDTAMAPADIGNTPRYWIRPTQILSAAPGFHRFVWDVHYAPPAGTSSQPGEYPISAVPFNTPREPRGPWALPGSYTVRLTIAGKAYTQPLVIRMDPRVKTSPAMMKQEHAMAMALYDAIAQDSSASAEAIGLRNQLRIAREHATGTPLAAAISTVDDKVVTLAGSGDSSGRRGGAGGRRRGSATFSPTFASINAELLTLMNMLEEADAEPTAAQEAAVSKIRNDYSSLVNRWKDLRTRDLPGLNAQLSAGGQAPISVPH
jgi:hypothetical protein